MSATPFLPSLDEPTIGLKPCYLCGATHPRDCQWSYMHCTRPDAGDKLVRLVFFRRGDYWRWEYAPPQADDEEGTP